MRPPIIVLGSPRSGTTLLCKTLADVVDWGATSFVACEDTRFISSNEWAIRSRGGTWDRPIQVHGFEWEFEETLQAFARSWPWGFKDPRSLLTWPSWEMASNRTAIYLVTERHPADIAASLWRRETSKQASLESVTMPDPGPPPMSPLVVDPMKSAACQTLDGAYSVWLGYENARRRFREEAGIDRNLAARSMFIRFEDMVSDPIDFAGQLSEFLGVDVEAPEVNPERAYGFDRDGEVSSWFERRRGDWEVIEAGYHEVDAWT